ncbi:MAG: hypothetical protein NPIRA01_24120 [Nitrospirales bacterium]|nr:MAG: hypothetical protein NPIRA01_24120 [Nitrospirales bacterium]
MADTYLWATIRNVERNPVRAGLVLKAERYRWSSAAAHCHIREDPVLTTKAGWWAQFNAIYDWASWLAEGDEPEKLTVIRRHIEKGLPCGSERFLKKLE